jgi:hypothetical protein
MCAGRLRLSGIADFNVFYQADPSFASAWNQVNAQLNIEGSLTSDIEVAKASFADAFVQLPQLNADLHGLGIADAAKSFVMAARTVAGAVQTVQGFVDAGAGRPRDEIVLGFMGSMIGTLTTAAIGAGAVTAGVGAAIVVGAGVAVSAIESILGGPPQGPGCQRGYSADFKVDNVCATGQKVSPAAGDWRSFPDRNSPGDAGWFQDFGKGGGIDWKGAHYGYDLNGANPSGYERFLLDYAFENYQSFELYAQGQVAAGGTPGLPDFLRALAAAWRSNAEFGLNGVVMQPDVQVLIHVVRKWNRSHAGPQVPMSALGDDFLHQLAASSFDIISTSDSIAFNGTKDLALNAGPVVSVSAAASSTAKKAATVALGFPAAIAVATVLHSWATGHAIDWGFQKLWGWTKGVLHHVRENPLELAERTTTTVQSLLFPRSEFSPSEARAWARGHGYRTSKTHVTGEHVRLRQRPPGDFARSSFRTISFGGSGIKAVVGHLR